MKRQEMVNKIAQAEKELAELAEKRKNLRESVAAYNMILDMTAKGQLDIFEDDTKTKTTRG